MILFYQAHIAEPIHTLDPEESRHCIRVLRMKNGDTLHLTDGRGLLCQARIIDDSPRRCMVEITESLRDNSRDSFRTHLAVAPTKNISRYEWFLEKATEIGVDEITPLVCANSERKTVNTDRLNKILIAAMKQSLKSFLPKLHKAVMFEEFIRGQHTDERFIAYCSDAHRDQLKDMVSKGSDCVILIGPEGDFSDEEVKAATGQGFRPVSLGHSRLRTETAAIVATHTIQMIND